MENEGIKVTKKDKALIIGITILSVIVFTGVGFAFFSANASNTNHETISTETASISLKFSDNDNGISKTLNLGESVTKTFTLENTGTKDAYAKINFVNLVNTYTENSLTYVLEQSETENGTYTAIGSGNVPVSTEEATKLLKNSILVPTNAKYYYKLTITLNNLDVEQNSDINATFHSFFSLEEGKMTDNILQVYNDNTVDKTSTDVIEREATDNSCTNTFAYDETGDNNLRYVGANPCNYVSFNDELWRIIGVMNNVEDENGNKETRIKLIRNESLGVYSWDTSESSINSGRGINDWTQSDLMQELNGDYLDLNLGTNKMWYSGVDNKKESEYLYTKGIKISAQNMINSTNWFLGGASWSLANNTVGEGMAIKFYEYERGNSVYPSGTPVKWIGKVALIYPSDYGYAVGGEVRATCLNKRLTLYNSDNCNKNNWINDEASRQWTLTPRTNDAYYVFLLRNLGVLGSNVPSTLSRVYPSVYLKSNINIISGLGTKNNPFVFG